MAFPELKSLPDADLVEIVHEVMLVCNNANSRANLTGAFGSESDFESLAPTLRPHVITVLREIAENLAQDIKSVPQATLDLHVSILGRIINSRILGSKPVELVQRMKRPRRKSRRRSRPSTDIRQTISHAYDYLGSVSNYDPYGNLLSTTDPGGETTMYSYDADGRLTSVSNESTEAATHYTYDGFGGLTDLTLPHESSSLGTSFNYDALGGRLEEQTYIANQYLDQVNLVNERDISANEFLNVSGDLTGLPSQSPDFGATFTSVVGLPQATEAIASSAVRETGRDTTVGIVVGVTESPMADTVVGGTAGIVAGAVGGVTGAVIGFSLLVPCHTSNLGCRPAPNLVDAGTCRKNISFD